MDMRMRPTFERYTVMGASPCDECKVKIAAGFVALVECDPKKTKRERDADGVERCNPKDVYTTGRSMWIRADAFQRIFKDTEPPVQYMSYIEPDVYDTLAAMAERANSGAAVQ